MSSAANNFSPTRFAYDDIPERDRAAVWWEVVGRKVFRAEVEPLADGPFQAEITCRALPDLSVVTVSSSGQSFVRTPQLIADGKDQFLFSFTRSGTVVAAQN